MFDRKKYLKEYAKKHRAERTAYFKARYEALTEKQREANRKRARDAWRSGHWKRKPCFTKKAGKIQLALVQPMLTKNHGQCKSSWFNTTMAGKPVVV